MVYELKHKICGWIWIIISPILWLMAAISSVESITIYYIQLTFFSIIAIVGMVSGISLLFKFDWAYVALKYLSWLGFIFFSGSGVVMLAYSIPLAFKGDFEAVALLFPIGLGVVVTGFPFYFMAKTMVFKIKI